MRNGSAILSILQNSQNSSPKTIAADYADCADVSLGSRSSHSEATTAEESETLQAEAVCFPFLAHLVKLRSSLQPARPVLSAKLHSPGEYQLPVCLSFHNGPDRKAERKSLRRYRF